MATNQLSLNQIIQYFAQMAASLQRVHSFGYGPVEDLGRDNPPLYGAPIYPLMWIEPQTSTLRKDSTILSHKIYIVDLVQPDLTNRQDVLSDSLRTCQEIKAYIFKDFIYDIFPTDESQMDPLFYKFDDNVEGYSIELDLQLDWLANVCTIPGLYPSGTTFSSGPDYYNVVLTDYLPLAGGVLFGPLTGTTAFFQSLSANSIFSGSTNLYDIFSSDIVRVQPGLNTYTGGTPVNPTVNITGATSFYIQDLTASTINSNSITANTVSASSFFSGTTNLSNIFGSGSNILFGKTDTVYLFGNANDAAAAGGPANNAFTTFQAAYDKANSLATGTTTILLSVLNTSSGNTGNLILTADYNTNIRIEGYSFNTSRLGSIITSASTGSSFNVGGTGLTQFVYLSNVNLQNIKTVLGNSGSTFSAGRVRLALNNVLMQNIDTSVPVANWTGNGGGIDIGGSGGTLSANQAIPNTTVGQVNNITTQARTTGGTAGSVTITAPYYNFGSITTAVNNFGGLLNLQNIGSIFGSIQCTSNSSLAHQFSDIAQILNGITLSDTGGTKTISGIKHKGSVFTINNTQATTYTINDSTFTGQFQGNSAVTVNGNNVFFSTNGGTITVGGSTNLKNTNILGSLVLASGSTGISLQGCQIAQQVFLAGLQAGVYNTSCFAVLHDIGPGSAFQNSSCIAGIDITGNNCRFSECSIQNSFKLNSSGVTGTVVDTCAIEFMYIPAGASVSQKNSYTQNVLAPIGAVNPNPGLYLDIESSISKLNITATTVSAFTLSATNIITRSVQPTQVAYSNPISGLTGSSNFIFANNSLIVSSLSGGSISGGTLYSGSTNLYDIFSTSSGSTTFIQPTQIAFGNALSGLTGHPFFYYSLNSEGGYLKVGYDQGLHLGNDAGYPFLSKIISQYSMIIGGISSLTNLTFDYNSQSIIHTAPGGHFFDTVIKANSLSATTVSGGTLYSGSTNLYDIFSTGNSNININPMQIAYGNSLSGITGTTDLTFNGNYFNISNSVLIGKLTGSEAFLQPQGVTFSIYGHSSNSITRFYTDGTIDSINQGWLNKSIFSSYALSSNTLSAGTLYTKNTGTVILTGGTAIVNTTKITANSNIFMNYNSASLTQIGVLAEDKSARVNGTSFTITSSNPTDTSTVAWFIIEQY